MQVKTAGDSFGGKYREKNILKQLEIPNKEQKSWIAQSQNNRCNTILITKEQKKEKKQIVMKQLSKKSASGRKKSYGTMY